MSELASPASTEPQVWGARPPWVRGVWADLFFAAAWLSAGMFLFRIGPASLALVLPWLVYVFMLRVFALQPPLRAFLSGTAASTVIMLPVHAAWYGGGLPEVGWVTVGAVAALAGALSVFPYLAHRLIAGEMPRLWAVFVFPLAATLVESWNALELFTAGPAGPGLPGGIWLLGAPGVLRGLPDASLPGLLGIVFLLALTASVAGQIWQRLNPLT
jgi:hypothetical protein